MTTATAAPFPIPGPAADLGPPEGPSSTPAPTPARAWFRCRFCGERFPAEDLVPDGEAVLADALAAVRVGLPLAAIVHRCGVKQTGLADLVGVQAL